MKKIVLILALVAVAVSCDKLNEKQINEKPTNGGEKVTLSAKIEASSRVVINSTDDATFNHFWEDGDQIRVFDGGGNSADFDLNGYDAQNPSNTASFTGSFAYTPAGAVYPAANADAAFNGTNFTVTFPAAQTYTANTYDPAANVYVATCSGSTLSFKSLSAYVRIALWSETASTAVDHIVLTSLDSGKIAGKASVDTEGNVTMDGSAVSTITLNCATPVTISNSSTAPTYFYIAVPAVAATGLKIDVYKADGSHLWRNVSVNPANKKNTVLKMGALEYSPEASSSVSLLTTGSDFNMKIKKLSDGGNYPNAYTNCTAITEIIFEVNKNMTGIEGVDVSAESDGSIKATFSNGIIRIQTRVSNIQMNNTSSSLFRKMSKLTRIEGLNYLKYVTASSGNDWRYMFRDDSLLVSVDLSSLKVEKTFTTQTRQMFMDCTNIESIQMPSSTTIYSSDARQMFSGCSKLTTVANFKTASTCSGVDSLFYNCSSLSTIDLSNFNTKKVTTAKQVFRNCFSLSTITFGSNSTFEVCTTMTHMFDSCMALASVNLSNFNTSNVTSMSYMFRGCEDLASLNLSNFNTSNVTDMSYMFKGCKALTSLDLSGFNTRKVTTMKSLCELCSNMIELVLSGDDCSTEAMTEYTGLSTLTFNCYNLLRLKLGNNFDLGSSRFPQGLHHQVLTQASSMTTGLTVYSNQTIATDFLQQIGKTTSNYRAVDLVKANKLHFKSLDGSTDWKFYSDSGRTNEIQAANVTSTSYVGLSSGEAEAQASTTEPVASYGAARTGGVSF